MPLSHGSLLKAHAMQVWGSSGQQDLFPGEDGIYAPVTLMVQSASCHMNFLDDASHGLSWKTMTLPWETEHGYSSRVHY